jgi:glycosyltransferase involved in cell wall biosynthesis
LKIILLQEILPVYREALFEELRTQAVQGGHDFELWVSPVTVGFAKRSNEGRGLPWARFFPMIGGGDRFFGLRWQRLPWREVLACDLMIIPDHMRTLSNIFALLLRRLTGKCVVTWGHGANFQPDGISRQLEKVRYRLLLMVHGHLVYTSSCVAPLTAAGFDRSSIAITENAVDASAAAALHSGHPDVVEFRARLGLGDDPCVVFLGSWYARKRPELIPRIGEALRERVPHARVLVIGAGDGLRVIQKNTVPWLMLLGPLHGYEKFVALAASRCLVVSGMAGLNVLDAMAVGLPVVLPQCENHGPEAAYVHDNVNGLIVDDDVAQLAAASADLCLNAELQARLGDAARNTAAALSIQKMAANLLNHSLAFFSKLFPGPKTTSGLPYGNEHGQ